MPAWEELLPDDQRWELVNYIRTFARPDSATTSAAK
jgi:mono/diheme cytochrome c family protein